MSNGTNGNGSNNPAPSQALVHQSRGSTFGDSMAIVPNSMEQVGQFVKMIAESMLLPDELKRNVANTTLVVMRGMELGIPPIQALSMFHVIKGKVALSATAKRGLCQSRAGVRFEYPELTSEAVTVKATRPSTGETVTVRWTFQDAVKAGLPSSNQNWNKYPKKMLVARATSEACDFIAADVVAGLPVVEDVEDIEDADPRGAGSSFQAAPPAAAPAEEPKKAPRATKAKDPTPPPTPAKVIDAVAEEKTATPPAAAAAAPPAAAAPATTPPSPSSPPSAPSPASAPADDEPWSQEAEDPMDRFERECKAAPSRAAMAELRKAWAAHAKSHPGDINHMKEVWSRENAAKSS